MSSPSTAVDGANAVEVRGLSKVFNAGRPDAVEALVDVDLVIRPGEFVSLIGPSGCGKSTQLRLIANLTEPTTGQVLVNGKPAKAARLDQDYGMAFQLAGLFEWRTVTKNVELPLELKRWDKAKRRSTLRARPSATGGSETSTRSSPAWRRQDWTPRPT
jgi:NitT/TauT family transport system ATP-binding protein